MTVTSNQEQLESPLPSLAPGLSSLTGVFISGSNVVLINVFPPSTLQHLSEPAEFTPLSPPFTKVKRD